MHANSFAYIKLNKNLKNKPDPLVTATLSNAATFSSGPKFDP